MQHQTAETLNDLRPPDGQVYALGHNEQMQVSVCVGIVAELLREQRRRQMMGESLSQTLTVDPEDMRHLDLRTVSIYESILGTPGLVTLTKEVEKQ